MSAIGSPLPPGVALLLIKDPAGTEFKLNKPAHYVDDEGYSVWHLNWATVDVFDSCNYARRQLHGDTPTPEADRRVAAMLAAREAEARSRKSEDRKKRAA